MKLVGETMGGRVPRWEASTNLENTNGHMARREASAESSVRVTGNVASSALPPAAICCWAPLISAPPLSLAWVVR